MNSPCCYKLRTIQVLPPALALLLLALATPAMAAIEAVVDTYTGEFYLRNQGGAIEFIDAYEVTSSTSSLVDSAWTPIAGNYDSNGDGSVSPLLPWFVLNSSSVVLAEAGSESSGSLDPDEIVSLGAIWSTADTESLEFRFFVGVNETVLSVDYRALAGDYDGDLDVDELDYTIWSSSFGSTELLAADGNGDGVVDIADYTVWRDDFVDALGEESASASISAFSLAIPEPSSLLLAFSMLAVRTGRRSQER